MKEDLMKFSEILYAAAKDLWEEAAEKPFVIAMADGTLDPARFRFYMLQDYLYLLDYIDILKSIRTYTRDPSLQAFLDRIIGQTEQETYRVHVPNMKEAGVSEEEIRTAVRADVITAYVAYMRGQLTESGLMAGLTALLQCSWVYAYIGEKVSASWTGRRLVSARKKATDSAGSSGNALSLKDSSGTHCMVNCDSHLWGDRHLE